MFLIEPPPERGAGAGGEGRGGAGAGAVRLLHSHRWQGTAGHTGQGQLRGDM